MRTIILLLNIFIFTASGALAQWDTKYSSAAFYNGIISGWMNFQKSGDVWENRIYYLDATSFNIMAANYSNEVEYSYTFTPDEITAGYLIYSLRADVTQDGIVDFYVMAAHGDASNYRKSFKILNVATGAVVFEKNDWNYSYSTPAVWDIDNDGQLECSFTRTEYPSGLYYYQEVFSTGSAVIISSPRETIPEAFNLKQNYPNPFNPLTTVEFYLDQSSDVSLDIYDLQGGLVRTLVKRYMDKGDHKIVWDGKNEHGSPAASGVYMYHLNAGGKSDSKKMIVLK
jgi:hypothetical protein